MNNVSTSAKTAQTPVFITFTPEKEKELGLNRNIDQFPKGTVNKFERTPEMDCYGSCNMAMAMKIPSPTQIAAGFAILPVILENGKKILIGIFDIRDIWNERSGQKSKNNEPQLKAMVIPDEIAEALTNTGIIPEA